MSQIKNLETAMIPFNFVFGAIVVVGGLIGFFTAQSYASLAAGLFFGNLLMLSIWGSGPSAKDGKFRVWGYYLASIASVTLLTFFILRLLKTGKPMPAVIIIPISVLGILGNTFVLHKLSIK
jgi:uncharacterized membrane protein (UPF0136 family)